MKRVRTILTLTVSLAALVGAGIGVRGALRSAHFVVGVVEVTDSPEQAPVDAAEITRLAAIPVGEVNLFDLDLREVEARILTNPWVRSVRLQKSFPQTISIAVTFREPKALAQGETGTLAYVDIDGTLFGQVDLSYQSDLPTLIGFATEPKARVQEAMRILSGWEKSSLSNEVQVSTLSWDAERGFRALVTYPMLFGSNGRSPAQGGAASTNTVKRGRTMVDLGHEVTPALDAQYERLSQVFQYLSNNSVAARQIWADAGKKIVVKYAHGS